MHRLTKHIPFADKNQCPLFNNQYRILGIVFAQIFLDSDSIDSAKKTVNRLVLSQGGPLRAQQFHNTLLFTVQQLALNLEYIR